MAARDHLVAAPGGVAEGLVEAGLRLRQTAQPKRAPAQRQQREGAQRHRPVAGDRQGALRPLQQELRHAAAGGLPRRGQVRPLRHGGAALQLAHQLREGGRDRVVLAAFQAQPTRRGGGQQAGLDLDQRAGSQAVQQRGSLADAALRHQHAGATRLHRLRGRLVAARAVQRVGAGEVALGLLQAPDGQRGIAGHALPLGRRAREGLGVGTEQPQHGLHRAAGVQVGSHREQSAGGVIGPLRREQQRLAAQRVALERRGAPQQQRPVLGPLDAQAMLQSVAEQVVQTQRRAGLVDHAGEQAAALDLVEPARGTRVAGQRRAARLVELVQHAGVEQEGTQPRVEVAPAPRWRESRTPGGRCRARPRTVRAAERQPQAGGPAGGAPMQRVCGRCVDAQVGAPGLYFVRGERQVALAEGGQLAGRGGARDQRCRRCSRLASTSVHCRGSRSIKRGEHLLRRLVDEVMHVVEHDGARHEATSATGSPSNAGSSVRHGPRGPNQQPSRTRHGEEPCSASS